MVKESLRGNSNYSEADLEEMAKLRMTNMASPETGAEEVITEPVKPISPADVKLVKPKVVLGVKSRDELKKTFIDDKIKQLRASGESNYDPANTKLYNDIYGRAFDKLNPARSEKQNDRVNKSDKSKNNIVLNNIEDIVRDGYGRLSVSKNGENIAFDKFDIAIDNDTKTAEVVFIQKKDRTENKGIGLESYIELGERLKEKGITLQSLGQAQLIGGKNIWDTLVKNGLAKKIASGRYEYIGKTETENKSKSPSELSLSELNELPNSENFNETNKQALAELNSINFNDKQSVKDGISKILEIINNKFIPENKVEQVLKTKEKLIGNSNYYSKEYLEKYIQYTTKDFSELKQLETNKKENEQPKEQTTSREEPVATNVTETKSEDAGVSKEIKVRTGVSRLKQKIKDPNRIKAMKIEVFSPEGIVMQHFIGGGKVSKQAVIDFYKGSETEANLRSHMVAKQEKYGKAYAPDFDDLAHSLWAANEEKLPNSTTEDYKAAVESVVQEYTSIVQMAKDLIASHTGDKATKAEEMMSKMHEQAEKDGTSVYVDAIQNEVEKLSDEEIEQIANDQKSFDEWQGENKDIITGDAEGDVFQKSKELEYAEGELIKAERELSASKKAFDAKRKELDKGLIADQEDLFGERKSTDETSLFDERATVDARNEAVKPFKDRYDAAVKNYKKWQDKVASLEGTEDSQTSLFQKASAKKANVEKIVNKLKSSMPNVKVVFDENLKAAGKWSPINKTITINPYHAGLDTPIHEYGHVLIDAIGYNNKVIQAAIKQLKTSPLWAETKERYKELDEENLGKEVLAEAIGREGAGIFDKESEKSKFKVFLEYIFDWLKTKLGINKNIAKSLAKQIIGGVGTKDIVGKGETEQFQKNKSYKEQLEQMVRDIESKDLMEMPIEELTNAYNIITRAQLDEQISGKTSSKLLDTVMKKIALNIIERGIKDSEKQVDRAAVEHKDITSINSFMRVLSHFSDAFPGMKHLSKLWDKAFLGKVKEAEELKNTHQKLAEAVIKEENKKLGIIDKGKQAGAQILFDIKHRFFRFMDNGEGKIITVSEAKQKGLSDAKIAYVKYVRELIGKKLEIEGNSVYEADMDVLKLNKSTGEKFQTEGLISGLASLMTSDRLNNIRISFTNPITGKTEVTEFKNAKAIISKFGQGDISDKFKAVKLLLTTTLKTKSQFKKGYHADGGNKNWPMYKSGTPALDENGNLPSKFGKDNSGDANYSTDFYNAIDQYIDDYTHIKHISPLVPIINSMEHLAKNGITDEDGNVTHKKKVLAKWFERWQKLHILKSLDEFEPTVDATLRTLRFITSARTMLFNVPAQGLNLAIGVYNNWVDMNFKDFAIGLGRMFGGKNRGFGVTNKYMMDIARKYHAVSVDMDSNPLRTGLGVFSSLGFAGTKFGEIIIQTSGLAGRMSEKDYNSFEYKKNKHGVEELVIKDSLTAKEKEELEERIQDHINKVSDIQGKYGEKDKRNIMNNELGKTALQMKVWIPDWYRTRFGDVGRWTKMLEGGFKELRDDMKEKGTVKAFWENKNFMNNLKGVMMVAFLVSLVYGDDDDDEKSMASKAAQRFLSDVLFVFDPNTAKFTISRPAVAIGTIEKLIDATDHLLALEADDFYKTKSTWGDKGESKLRGDIMNFVPGKKVIEYVTED